MGLFISKYQKDSYQNLVTKLADRTFRWLILGKRRSLWTYRKLI